MRKKFFEIEEISNMLRVFSEATGVHSCLCFPDGSRVFEEDSQLSEIKEFLPLELMGFEGVREAGSMNIRLLTEKTCIRTVCNGALWEAGIRLETNGIHLGNWLIGYVKNDDLPTDAWKSLLEKTGIGTEKTEKAFRVLKGMNSAEFQKVAELLFVMGGQVNQLAQKREELNHQIKNEKQAFDQVLENEEMYRQLVEHSPDAILIHVEGIVKFANSTAVKLLEAESLDQLVGMRAVEIVHPDSLETVKRRISSIIANNQSVPLMEEKLLTLKGNILIAEVAGIPINLDGKKAIQVIARDIRHRKTIEDELISQERLIRLMVDFSSDILVLLDQNGFQRYVSPSAEKITGFRIEELMRPFSEVVHPDDLEALQSGFEELLRNPNEIQKIEYRHKHKTEGYRYFETIGRNFLNDPYINGIVANVRDISDRKEIELALKKSELDFRTIFEESPVAILVEDFSFVKKQIDEIRHSGIGDFTSFLGANTREVLRLASFIRIVDINHRGLDLLAVSRSEALSGNFSKFLTEESIPALKEQMIAIANGKTNFQSEIPLVNGQGLTLHLVIKITVPVEYQKNFERVLVSFIDLTNLKNAQRKIDENEKRLKDIMFSMADWIWEVDALGRYTFASDKVVERIGYSPAEVIGKTPFDFMSPKESEKIKSVFSEIVGKKGLIVDLENNVLTKDGRQLCFVTNGVPIIDAKGELHGYRGIDKDITEKKQAELLKDEQFRYSRALNELGEIIFESEDAGVILESTNRIIGESLHIDRVRILEVSHTTDELNLMSEWLRLQHPDIVPSTGKYSSRNLFSNVIDHILENNLPVESYCDKVNPLFESKEVGRIVHKEMKIKSLLWYPFGFSEQGFFVFTLNQLLEIRRWTPTEIHFLESVSRLVSMAILKIRLMEERMEYIKRLSESENKFKSITEQSPGLIAVTDELGIIRYASPASAEIFGYSPEEMTGESFEIYLHESNLEIGNKIFHEILNSGKSFKGLEFKMRRKDGQVFTGELTGSAFSSLGTKGTLVEINDISPRKEAEERLKQSEEKFRLIAENTGDAIVVINMAFQFVYASPSVQNILGYSVDEFLELKLDQILYPESLEKVLTIWQTITQPDFSGIPGQLGFNSIEIREFHKNGSDVWVELSFSFLKNELNKVSGVITVSRNITDRKQSEEALRKSERIMAGLLNGIPEPTFMIDREGTLLFMNEAFARENNLTQETLTGSNAFDLLPDDLAFQRKKIIEEVLQSGNAANFEDSRDGEFFSNFVYPIKNEQGQIDRAVIFVLDITQKKKADDALKEREEILRTIFDNSPIGLEVFNREGILTQGNAVAFDMFGVRQEDVIGKFRLKDGPNFKDPNVWNQLESGMEVFNEISIDFEKLNFSTTKRGIAHYFIITTPVAESISREIGYIEQIIDISHQKLAELELIKAKEKAEESDRLKSTFLANLSHEIRTPMNGILGFSEILKDSFLKMEEREDLFELIKKSGERLMNTISDIIDISKIESGQIQVSLLKTDIWEQMNFIQSFFRFEAEQKGLQLINSYHKGPGEDVIYTDPEKLFAILSNLIKNGIKYTHKGYVEFGFSVQGDLSCFFVRDTGIGIATHVQSLIFERFRQGNDALNKDFEGSGLGLSISKAYVEKLGGKIWVESELGLGSVFYFTIPNNTKKGQPSPLDPPYLDLKEIKGNLTVLIAEDDEISEKLLTRIVKSISDKVLVARNGIETVELCRENPDISILLVDIRMPGMDGLEATRIIRSFNRDIVIIAQTAFALAGDREKALEAGCNEYISKPLNRKLLIDLIGKYGIGSAF